MTKKNLYPNHRIAPPKNSCAEYKSTLRSFAIKNYIFIISQLSHFFSLSKSRISVNKTSSFEGAGGAGGAAGSVSFF